MARVSRKAKADSHARILEEASRMFREQGVEVTGVADIMKAAGLTHGGFYRHFNSKDDLARAAVLKVMVDITDKLEAAIIRKGAKSAVADFVKDYLSEKHTANPGSGCPIAALGADVHRGGQSYADILSEGSQRLIGLLGQGMAGGPELVRAKATGLLASLVGTVILARTAPNKAQLKAILGAGRQSAKALF